MAETLVKAWLDTRRPPGQYALLSGEGADRLRIDPPPKSITAACARRISVELLVPAETAAACKPGDRHLPDGCAFEVARLNDPEVKASVLGLEEAKADGLSLGQFHFMSVKVGPEGMRQAGFADVHRARGFLVAEIEEARSHGGAEHWEQMLEDTFDDANLPPCLAFGEDGLYVIDGRHRIAGFQANDLPGEEFYLGLPRGVALRDCPGIVLHVPGAEYPQDPGASPTLR